MFSHMIFTCFIPFFFVSALHLEDSAWIYDGTAVRLLASSGQGLAGSEGLKAMRRRHGDPGDPTQRCIKAPTKCQVHEANDLPTIF
jgi:hypothetical protein